MKAADILHCVEQLPEDSVAGLLVVHEGIQMELVSLGDGTWSATCPNMWDTDGFDMVEVHRSSPLEALQACHIESLKEPLIPEEDEDEDEDEEDEEP